MNQKKELLLTTKTDDGGFELLPVKSCLVLACCGEAMVVVGQIEGNAAADLLLEMGYVPNTPLEIVSLQVDKIKGLHLEVNTPSEGRAVVMVGGTALQSFEYNSTELVVHR
jgi:hypothetical protein